MTEMFTADIRHYIAARGLDLVHFAGGQHKDEVGPTALRFGADWHRLAARSRRR